MRHLVSVDDVHEDTLIHLTERALFWRGFRRNKKPEWRSKPLDGRLLITDFYEPSTRTRLSFEAAMSYLGGSVIGTENAAEFSSAKKGESLADNFRVISGYCDVIVGRFKHEGEARIAAQHSNVPLINGGDGTGEHPTQALINFMTIYSYFEDVFLIGATPTVRITFLGDNKRSRTVRSLVRLLMLRPQTGEMNFISPSALQVETDILDDLDHRLIPWNIRWHLDEDIMRRTDILYMTRSQNERGETIDGNDYALTPELADMMPGNAIIMHPLPRNSELPESIDSNKRAVYFEQAHNGLYVRMAILEWLLG